MNDLGGSEMLVGDRLRLALDEAFTGTDDAQLRHTAYDLRVASDLCVVPAPDAEGNRGHVRHVRGAPGPGSFDLLPGESAFVSTHERIHLPWTLAGTVGTKFSMAAKGLLVLTGSCIDPGYGLTLDEHGAWRRADDQRLHFVLANVGPEPIRINCAQTSVAAIQLTRVTEVVESARREIRSAGFESLEKDFLADPSSPPVLAYFRQIRDLKEEFARFREREAEHEKRAEIALAGVNTVVLFGVYLLAVTIMGVLLATSSESFGQWLDSDNWWVRGPALGLVGVVAAAIGALTVKSSRTIGPIRSGDQP